MNYRQKIETRTAILLEKARAKYPEFKCKAIITRIANCCIDNPHAVAEATWWNYTILYNQKFFKVDFDIILSEVVPHEIAHIVAYQVYGTDIGMHGREWRNIARFLGNSGSIKQAACIHEKDDRAFMIY